MKDQKKMLEAALFISSKPLMLDDIAKILNVNSLGYVKELLESLQKEYEKRGIELVKNPEGWQFQVRHEYMPQVSKLTPYQNISEGSKRTLAIIAYKEPIKQSEIIRLQGNKAYSYIKSLIKMDLVNAKKVSRTKILTLTQEFERYFGEEKKRIKQAMNSEVEKLAKKPVQIEEEPKPQIAEETPKPEPEQDKPTEKKKAKAPAKKNRSLELTASTKERLSRNPVKKNRVDSKKSSRKASKDPKFDSNVEKTEQPIEELVL